MAKGPKNPERSFGVSVGAVLLVIAAALWWRGRVGRAEVLGGIGAVLLLFGAVRPQLLKWPSAAWWRFAGVLAYVNARILLTLLFSLLLVPLSLVWRVLGKDPLARRREKFQGWTPYPERYRDRTHFERMF
jgi:saxitoxin biosynthesis operon SxtJ-like protein